MRRHAGFSTAQQNARAQINNFARTETHKNLVERDSVQARQLRAQQVRTTVGIAIRLRDGIFHRFDRFRRGTKRVFVGRQLDGVNLQLALDFFDGSSGNVGGEPTNIFRNQICNRMRHQFYVFSELCALCALCGELLVLIFVFAGAVKVRRNCATSRSCSVR